MVGRRRITPATKIRTPSPDAVARGCRTVFQTVPASRTDGLEIRPTTATGCRPGGCWRRHSRAVGRRRRAASIADAHLDGVGAGRFFFGSICEPLLFSGPGPFFVPLLLSVPAAFVCRSTRHRFCSRNVLICSVQWRRGLRCIAFAAARRSHFSRSGVRADLLRALPWPCSPPAMFPLRWRDDRVWRPSRNGLGCGAGRWRPETGPC